MFLFGLVKDWLIGVLSFPFSSNLNAVKFSIDKDYFCVISTQWIAHTEKYGIVRNAINAIV